MRQENSVWASQGVAQFFLGDIKMSLAVLQRQSKCALASVSVHANQPVIHFLNTDSLGKLVQLGSHLIIISVTNKPDKSQLESSSTISFPKKKKKKNFNQASVYIIQDPHGVAIFSFSLSLSISSVFIPGSRISPGE